MSFQRAEESHWPAFRSGALANRADLLPCAALQVECAHEGVGRAEAVVAEMIAAGVKPDAVTWATVLAAAQGQGRRVEADRARHELETLQSSAAAAAAAHGEGEADAAAGLLNEGGASEEAGGEGSRPALTDAAGGRHWKAYYALDEDEEW